MAGAMQTLHQQQQTPQRPPRRLRQRQATLVLGVVLAAVVGCATAFVPSSPAPRVQGQSRVVEKGRGFERAGLD